ncbi:hypothetical protein P4V64_26225, partial [Bacillus thuringiensis]|nr:hypothetical protein [Bacillus thuringiensis]
MGKISGQFGPPKTFTFDPSQDEPRSLVWHFLATRGFTKYSLELLNREAPSYDSFFDDGID